MLPYGVHLTMDLNPRFRANLDEDTDEKVRASAPTNLGGGLTAEEGEEDEKENRPVTNTQT